VTTDGARGCSGTSQPAYTSGTSAPTIIALGGGQVLLRGPAVVEVSRAIDWMIRVHERRDSVHASKPLRALQQLLAAEAAQVSARTFADVRNAAVVPPSQNMITTEEAAAMIRRSPRQIRRLAADLEGRQIAGRWLFDPDVVAAAAAERGITR
jgi:hypothetical protein